MIDGVHFADHVCVVAMGIDVSGKKHPLALAEGNTENATVVKDLLVDLRERGLDTTTPILTVIDGAKALSSAVRAVFDHPIIHRCNCTRCATSSPRSRSTWPRRWRSGCGRSTTTTTPCAPRPSSPSLPVSSKRATPGAAGSLREGLHETLTVMRLGVPPSLRAHAALDERIESIIEICRDHSANVKRWRDGEMALRRYAAGMAEAAKQFRRVNGFLHLPALKKTLEDHVRRAETTVDYNEKGAA